MYNFGPQQNNTNLIFVSGIEDVKQRFQMPNTTMEYADSNQPIRYQKTMGSMGNAEIKIFELKEKIGQNDTKQNNLTNLSTEDIKAEFDLINAKFKALEDKFNKFASVKSEISALKGEL